MWESLVLSYLQLNKISLESILSDKIHAIVIRNFYDEKNCRMITSRIKNYSQSDFQNGKLKYIGPFLMSHTTNKKKYFEDAKDAQREFEKIFHFIKNLSTIFTGYHLVPQSRFSFVFVATTLLFQFFLQQPLTQSGSILLCYSS